MAILRVIEGPEKDRELRLPAYPVVLGRGSAADLVLDDPRASRAHACIEIHEGRWTVRDLGTSNGTSVDGMRTAGRTALHTGSRIKLGHTVLLFDEETRTTPREERLVLPGYEILEEAGRGATGVVYRARQLSLDRVVALKVLAARLSARRDVVDRFVREARAAAQLHHPNVVQVFDVGQHGGRHHFSMEFMPGDTVEHLLQQTDGSRLMWREAVRLAADAARGLAFAEERGIVHRDVKPANLLLDEHGTVKLGDLGTAVRVDEAEAERIGTPHFMSPEQARREPVTHASDVYSLGATLYRMLAGRTPFQGGTDVHAIVNAVAHDEPAPVARFAPGLPAPVASLVTRMMHRDPAERPTAAECVERLTKVARGVTADRTEVRRRSRQRAAITKWVVRGLFLAALAGGVYVLREPLLVLFRRAVDRATAPGEESPPGPGAETSAATLAEETYGEILIREQALAPPDAANVAEWRRIAADYARMTEVFGLDLTPVVRAHWRAKEIRDEVAGIGGGDDTNAAFADRWLARALREAGLPEEADATSGTGPAVEGAAAAALLTERDDVLARADATVRGGDVSGALDDVLDWAREKRLAATAAGADSDVHQVIAGALAWVRRTARVQSARLEQDLSGDQQLLRARLRDTALFRRDGSWPGCAEADAAAALLEGLLLTPMGAARVRERRRRVASARAAWEHILTDWPAGSDARPTADGFETAGSIVPWTTLGAAEFARDVLLPGAERVPPEHAEGALWLLAEAAPPSLADAMVVALGAGLAEPVSAAVSAEIEARRAHTSWREPPDAAARADWYANHAGAEYGLLRADELAKGHPVFAEPDVERYFDTWGGARGEDR